VDTTNAAPYDHNDSITVSATAAGGYTFVKWVATNSAADTTVISSNASYTFTITQNTTLYAVFAPKHTLSVAAVSSQSGWGTAVDTTGAAPYDHNQSVTVTATPTGGYTFVKWVASNSAAAAAVSTNAAYSFSITGPTTLYAVFTKYTVTPTAGADSYYNDFAAALSSAATGSTITLYADASLTSTQTISSKAITLQSNDTTTRVITDSVTGKMFDLGSGATLTLGAGITLDGEGSANGDNPLVNVGSGAALVMNTGSTITRGNRNVGSWGGGVYVDNGTFTMNGGTINFNAGCGVGVGDGCQITMNDGTISGNTVRGVYISGQASGSHFIMNDGTISGNTFGNTGAGVYLQGGGGTNSTFTMSGGAITGNTSTGIARMGGGVYIGGYGQFTMSGSAAISGNGITGAGGSGGGVCINGSTSQFSMSGGTISGNQVTLNGGGVHIQEGTFAITGSAGLSSITSNTASGDGDKVYKEPNGTFTIGGPVATSGSGGSTTGASGSAVYWD
jgi:hypothetical protein